MYVSEGSLDMERALHGAQSTTQPFLRWSAIVLLLLLKCRGREDVVVGIRESPDGGVWSRSGGNGTKLIAWGGISDHSALWGRRATYG